MWYYFCDFLKGLTLKLVLLYDKMVRPRRKTCTQYKENSSVAMTGPVNDSNNFQDHFLKLENILKEIHHDLKSKINDCSTKIDVSHNELINCNKAVSELRSQVKNVQLSLLEKDIVIISYEDSRACDTYCHDILNKLKISRNDIRSKNVIFTNSFKTIYKVHLSNKLIVNQVLQSKSALRGSRVYIHRPYTEEERMLRKKQVQSAIAISDNNRFRIFKNKLFINNLVYNWSESDGTFILNNTDGREFQLDLRQKSNPENIRAQTAQQTKNSSSSVKSGFLLKMQDQKTFSQESSEKENTECSDEESFSESSSDVENLGEAMRAEINEARSATIDDKLDQMLLEMQKFCGKKS